MTTQKHTPRIALYARVSTKNNCFVDGGDLFYSNRTSVKLCSVSGAHGGVRVSWRVSPSIW